MPRRPEGTLRPTDISPISRVMRRVDLVADGSLAGDVSLTGFPSVDRWLGGGVRAGDLVAIAGDVASGKSALALAMALRMAQAGTRVAFLSGEMSVERLMERALAIEGRVRVDDLRQGKLDEFARAGVGAAAVRLRDRSPAFEVLPAGGIDELSERLRGMNVAVVFVDPLQALAGASRSNEEELAAAVRALKAFAVERDVCVVVVTQVSLPDPSVRDDRRPTIDDLGTAGALRQSADVVLALYREEMYAPGGGVDGATELLVRKNRNGTTGYVDLYFYKQWLRFEDMLDPDR